MNAELVAALLDDLDAEQREAVESDGTPLCVLAGAGAGKTRVLARRVARRIADGCADPSHTLVLTFTRKAADELRRRIASTAGADTVITGTFHAVAYAQLRRRWLDAGRAVPVVASHPEKVLESAMTRLSIGRMANTRTIAAEISWAKSRRLQPDDYEEGVRRYRRRPPLSSAQVARLYDAYESEKRKRKTIDYDDLLLLMTDAISNERSFASTQRWRFRHFFVDEFQDVNKAQYDLLRAWLGDRDDLFVVGDPNQAIYGWNGADAGYLKEIDRYFPTVETIRLTTNYRSSPHVLAAAGSVLPGTDAALPEDRLAEGAGSAPVIRRFVDDQGEAAGVARAVRHAHGRNHRWRDIAVLVRTNVQRAAIELALEAHGVPFSSAGGAAWLYRPEVRGALEHLRETPRHRLAERAPDIQQMMDETQNPREYLGDLLSACRQCLADDPEVSIADFLSWIEVASRHDGPALRHGSSGAVTVTTFHRAKGLEWPVVFLAGVEEGLVPHGKPNHQQLEEEQRLFYVAVTRARAELHCSWATRRAVGNEVLVREPSRWLSGVMSSGAELEDVAQRKEVVHEMIEEGRAVLQVDHPTEDPVREAVESWRTARAKLTGIDAKLILADDVIDAIVDLRPQSTEQLSAIDGFGPVRAASVGQEIVDLLKSASASSRKSL